MEQTNQNPDFGRLSIISAVIILAYALVPFVQIPPQSIAIRLPWAIFNLNFDFGTLVSILVALLAALGVDWLIQTHPYREGKTLVRHGLVPALTAWVIGVPLSLLEVGLEWWVVLTFVLVAEFLVVDTKSNAHLPASIGLTAISFALYLILAIALQSSGLRLFLLLPALVVTLFFLVSRSLFLRTSGDWNWFWSAGIAFFTGQLALGLHYLPIQPLTFGLLLVSISYPLTLLVIAMKEGRKGYSLFTEPIAMFIIFFLLAIFTNG